MRRVYILICLLIAFVSASSQVQQRPMFWELNGTGCLSDPDVLSFFSREVTAGVTLSDAQKNAYADLVCDLKNSGVWSDLVEGGPMLGGTAAAHALFMKGTGSGTYVGSPTHASTGVAWNGTTQYYRTGVVPSTALTNNDYSFAYYSGSNTSFSTDHVMGVYTSNTSYLALIARNSSGDATVFATNSSTGINVVNSNAAALMMFSRTSSTSLTLWRNTTSLSTQTTANTGTLPNLEVYVGALNNGGSAGFYTNKECRGWWIFKGLNSTKAAAVQTAIIKYETALGRP
jgi:hypothetical protein